MKVLGLDIGTNSIGCGIVDERNHKIENCGVYIFPEGVKIEKGNESSKAAERTSYYAFNIDPEVRAFVAGLSKDKVGKIVNFGSAALLNSTYKKIKAEASKVGVAMDEKFYCKGEFKGMHKGRPNEDDIKAIIEFVKQYK